MLQSIRDRSQGWFTWIIIVFVCVTFAFWGIHNYLDGSSDSDVLAKVGGVKITRQVVLKNYRQMRDRQQEALGSLFTLDDQVQAQMKAAAMQQLITGEALLQAALKNGFRVSNQQVQELIRLLPEFQVDGQFSPQRLERILSVMGITYQTFAKQLSDELLLNQTKVAVEKSEFATGYEISKITKLLSQTRDFSYGILPLSAVLDEINTTDDEVRQFYEKNRALFKTPEHVSIEYVELDADKLPGSGAKAERLFAERYEQLANLSYEYPDSLKRASDELNLPIKTSESITRKGASDERLNQPEVLSAIFSSDVLGSHYNSEVINLSPTRAIVLRVKEHIPGDYKAFSDVKVGIEQQLKNEKARSQLKEIAEKIAQQDPSQLKEQLHKYGVRLETRNSIRRDAPGIDKVILQAAFSLPRVDHPVRAVPLSNGDYALVELEQVFDGVESGVPGDLPLEIEGNIIRDFARLDYDLYNKSVLDRSKIKLYGYSFGNDDGL